MAHIYNFSIIRVSPDPKRGELVNIGIVVFLRSKLDVRILPSLAKVNALHGELDLTQLHSLPIKLNSFVKGVKSVADRHNFIRRIGMVELSDLGQFVADAGIEYEDRVDDLLTRLVKPTVAPREAGHQSSKLHSQVRSIIKDAKILGRNNSDIENHLIVQNFPISSDKGLYADFVGKNSKFYVTETLDFRVGRGLFGVKFNESAKSALVLREARQKFGDSRRILMYAASDQTQPQVKPHLNLLEEFTTDIFNFESANDRARYISTLTSAFGGVLPIKV